MSEFGVGLLYTSNDCLNPIIYLRSNLKSVTLKSCLTPVPTSYAVCSPFYAINKSTSCFILEKVYFCARMEIYIYSPVVHAIYQTKDKSKVTDANYTSKLKKILDCDCLLTAD